MYEMGKLRAKMPPRDLNESISKDNQIQIATAMVTHEIYMFFSFSSFFSFLSEQFPIVNIESQELFNH